MADPHAAQRIVTLGCRDAAREPYALHMELLDHDDPADALARFLSDHVVYDSQTLALICSPAHADRASTYASQIEDHYRGARINQNTIEMTAERSAENFAHTLMRLQDGRSAPMQALIPALLSETCIVVGAGASLDADVEYLRGHQGPIIAVNTSLGALRRADIRPHVVVISESKDISEAYASDVAQWATGDRTRHEVVFALDACAHPRNHATEHTAVMISTEPNLLSYAQLLGIAPIPNGPSCVTQAIALAFALESEEIALVGFDCAMLAPRMYARGTPYEDTSVVIDHDARRVIVEGTHKPRAVYDAISVPAIDGGAVYTTHVYDGFARWVEVLPATQRARIVNCTSRGRAIAGVVHRNMTSQVALNRERAANRALDWSPDDKWCPQTIGGAALDRAIRTATAALALRDVIRARLRAVLDAAGDTDAVLRAANEEPLLHFAHAAARLRLRRSGAATTVAGRRQALAAAVSAASARLLGILASTAEDPPRERP